MRSTVAPWTATTVSNGRLLVTVGRRPARRVRFGSRRRVRAGAGCVYAISARNLSTCPLSKVAAPSS